MTQISRRHFVQTLAASAALLGAERASAQDEAADLPRGVELSPDGAVLRAGPLAREPRRWGLNDSIPGPTLRARTGARFALSLDNGLDEPTILHWHGLDAPQEADGHPRLAVGPGEQYDYAFTIVDRAGTYWYHPHPHMRTGIQTYLGLAGFLLVSDDEEDALGLPTAGYEIPLLLQDKRVAPDGTPVFNPFGPEHMTGFLGDRGFANGVEHPVQEVERTRYRLRILNGSNARLWQLAFSPEMSMELIGGDGGLLETARPIQRAFLGTGERLDVLVDFSAHRPGERVTLRSESFEVPGMMMHGGPGGMGRRGMTGGRGGRMGRRSGMGNGGHGAPMDLLDFVVQDTESRPGHKLPDRLSSLAAPEVGPSPTRRRFVFESRMGRHSINGRQFDPDRVDVEVPLGETEVWTFVNESRLPHPVHLHGPGFRVLSRTGGRNRVEPWERGIKDTVLLLPGEQVDAAIMFPSYRGLFLLHCHNLDHEDMGMMSNVAIV